MAFCNDSPVTFSNSTNAVSFSSARITKRFPLLRIALESFLIAARQMIRQHDIRRFPTRSLAFSNFLGCGITLRDEHNISPNSQHASACRNPHHAESGLVQYAACRAKGTRSPGHSCRPGTDSSDHRRQRTAASRNHALTGKAPKARSGDCIG